MMTNFKALSICFCILLSVCYGYTGEMISFTTQTEAPSNRNLEWTLRTPSGNDRQPGTERIMILFGGRNWKGDKTINSYHFNELADKYGLYLLSPSFKDDDYWEPEKWSGQALLDAVKSIQDKYKIPEERKLFLYGYSAGAQCANLFMLWKPSLVEAWGAHACGVWGSAPGNSQIAPGLVTCGEEDNPRYELSRTFVMNSRESGALIIWRSYPEAHALNKEALRLAELFFESVLSRSHADEYVGDDQNLKFYKSGTREADRIDREYKNIFFNLNTAEYWKTGR